MAPGTGAPFALRTVPSIARLVELLLGPMDRLELSGAVSGGGICGAICKARATGSIEANAAATRRLMPLFLVFFFFVFVCVVFILVEIEVCVLFILVVFRGKLHGVDACDCQRGSALIAGKNVSLIQFFFFHVDGSVTFRTTDHKIIDLSAKR